MLGKKTWQALRYYIAEERDFDTNKPDEMIEGSALFEKILTDLFGAGASLLFLHINQKLIESFSIKDSEKFAYTEFGDYTRFVEALKNKDIEKKNDKEEKIGS